MKVKLLTLVLGGALAAATASATVVSSATITNFNAVANTDNNGGFVFDNNPAITFSTPAANVGNITNAVIRCASSDGCHGTVLTFNLSAVGVNSTSPLVIAIDGSLSGETNATGSLGIAGLSIPGFIINTGVFNATLLNQNLASVLIPGGNLAISNATLSLNMVDGQTLTLPSSFSITVNAASTPEPGTIALMGVGLAGLAIFARRRRA